MEGWESEVLDPTGEFPHRFDVKDAYLSVLLAVSDRAWLCFLSQGTCYQWNVLSFGLRSVPKAFKVMKPGVACPCVRRACVVFFLDDILIVDQSPSRLTF